MYSGITQQAEVAVALALAEGDTEVRAMLAEQLETRARWAEDDEEADSPYLTLAAHLRELAARLREQASEDASGDTANQDSSAG